jgi:hypothetical protein
MQARDTHWRRSVGVFQRRHEDRDAVIDQAQWCTAKCELFQTVQYRVRFCSISVVKRSPKIEFMLLEWSQTVFAKTISLAWIWVFYITF